MRTGKPHRAAAVLLALALVLLAGCSQEAEEPQAAAEEVPFANTVDDYADMELSAIVDEIYASGELDELLLGSVERVTDAQTLSEIYYLPMDAVVDHEVRSADGRFGVADVVIIRARSGHEAEVTEALELRKSDRIAESKNFDVNDSYNIALGADVYEEGELVIMLMLPAEMRAAGRAVIDSYLPAGA